MALHLPVAFRGDLKGVFCRQDFLFLCVEMTTQACRVVIFPDPVSPTHQMMPCGFSVMS